MIHNHDELGKKLAHILSDVTALRFLAQGYHWNVKGINFYQFHEFFAEIYEDIDSSIDPLAENIRKLGYDSPYLLGDFDGMTCIHEERQFGDAMLMVESLARTNKATVDCYTAAFSMADSCNEQGIADFIAARIDMHQKWQWQLESTLGIR